MIYFINERNYIASHIKILAGFQLVDYGRRAARKLLGVLEGKRLALEQNELVIEFNLFKATRELEKR